MNKALWNKSVGEARWLVALCAAGMLLLCFLRVALLHWMEMSMYAEMLGNVWDKIEQFSTVPLSHLLTYEGRIAMVFNEPLLLLIIAALAISRGSDAVSGEISRGTMEFLLAQPVSRLQVLLTPAVVGVVGIAVVSAAAWAGTALGVALITAREVPPPPAIAIPLTDMKIPLPFLAGDQEPIFIPLRDEVDPRVFLPAAVNLFCVGVLLHALAMLASSYDRHRWRTIGIVVAICIAMSMLKVFGMATPALEWMKAFSFFTPYSPEWAVYVGMSAPESAWSWRVEIPVSGRSGVSPLANNMILLALSTVFYAVSATIFCRRDLPAPI